VLALLAHGLANAAIADRLCIADSTVKSHVAALFSKLGVSSREDAIAVARSSARPGADAVQAQRVGDPRRRRQII
jgi:DNA-binding NarL/FixJ family response regulator